MCIIYLVKYEPNNMLSTKCMHYICLSRYMTLTPQSTKFIHLGFYFFLSILTQMKKRMKSQHLPSLTVNCFNYSSYNTQDQSYRDPTFRRTRQEAQSDTSLTQEMFLFLTISPFLLSHWNFVPDFLELIIIF